MAKKIPKKTVEPVTSAGSLVDVLRIRFEKNMHRHRGIVWENVLKKVLSSKSAVESLGAMERTGGEPDVVSIGNNASVIVFADCSTESPIGRRSLCYDPAALASRKEHPPKGSVMGMAADMGVEVLDEELYRVLQGLGEIDTKTSSWLLTPPEMRQRGGALFGDCRFGRVFTYHNGAESYYAGRGFRAVFKL